MKVECSGCGIGVIVDPVVCPDCKTVTPMSCWDCGKGATMPPYCWDCSHAEAKWRDEKIEKAEARVAKLEAAARIVIEVEGAATPHHRALAKALGETEGPKR